MAVVAATDNQTGEVGFPVPLAPSVTVRDADGNPVAGVPVTFAVTGGGGAVSRGTPLSNANGVASPGLWTMGPAVGSNTLTATAAGLSAVTFSANAVPVRYRISLEYVTAISSSQRLAFDRAAARWQEIITGNLQPAIANPGDIPPGACGINHPAFTGYIDDLLIWVEVTNLDGPGGILGQAGPCFLRTASPPLPIAGIMQFDAADLANLQSSGTLEAVILHEMAHVLGVGTLWPLSPWNMLRNPSCPGGAGGVCVPDNRGADTHFTGSAAVAAFNGLTPPWNPPDTADSRVPVENSQGGPGSRDGHWRESTFVSELMTGFVSSGNNPLSVVTAAQFQDLGYQVDAGQADPYSLGNPNGLRTDSVVTIPMVEDVWRGPLYQIGSGPRLRLR
jgi:hypothetical protein